MASDASHLQSRELTADMFKRKTTIIYGASGTGKTTIVRHIMHLLHETVPIVIVFSSSETVNSTYSRDLVPRQFVHDDISADVIELILRRQSKSTNIHQRATRNETLESLFERCANDDERCVRDQLRNAYAQILREAGGVESPEIRETYETRYHAFLRKIIGAHLPQLESLAKDQHTARPLSEDESFAVRWFSFSPDLLIVVDDCTDSLGKLKNNGEMAQLLFKGRHSCVTTIITAHSDTFLNPSWRSNVGVSIFTSTIVANAYSAKATNGVTDRETFARYANAISSVAPYTKMMIAGQQMYLFVAQQFPAFSAVAPSVRRFAEKIARKDDTQWMAGL